MLTGEGLSLALTLLLEHKLKLVNLSEAFHETPLVLNAILLRNVPIFDRYFNNPTVPLYLDGIGFVSLYHGSFLLC